jgi:hypothetical protein
MQHELEIKVPLPGMSNGVEWQIPLHVNSGVGLSLPQAESAAI